MKRVLFLLPLLSSAFCFAEPSTDEALRSLLRVKAAAESAQRAGTAGAAYLNSVPYDERGPAQDTLAVPAGNPAWKASPLAPFSKPTAEAPQSPVPAPSGRFSGGYVGLYPESDFELTTGRCSNCNAPKEGMWYFLDEVVAVPKAGPPSLVWLGSHEMITDAMMSADGRSVKLPDGSVVPLSLVNKIASNRSFYNEATTAYLQNRPLRLRGEFVEENGVRRFVARTIWPEDYRIDFAALSSSSDNIDKLVKEDNGGAKGPFQTKLLWQRDPSAGKAWAGKPVMGVMLNGSQGDDDETHGGHFSFFAGRFGPNGEMADWMFSNFYDMDQVSEKGILPAFVPMDKYMADLNSGQSYYRPSDILVAVLKDDKPALEIQEKYKALYAKYYAHEVLYNHTTKSCAALIIDELRQDGWNVPKTGPSNIISARLLSTLVAVGSWNKKKGAEMYAAMRQEKSRLFPRAAFEAVGGDLLRLGGDAGRRLTPFEQELQKDLEAVVFVRLPQIPSSRAFGSYPVGSTEEYFHRVPMSHSKWKIIPTQPRPYPPPH